jgi:hypothetical protein
MSEAHARKQRKHSFEWDGPISLSYSRMMLFSRNSGILCFPWRFAFSSGAHSRNVKIGYSVELELGRTTLNSVAVRIEQRRNMFKAFGYLVL